MFEPKEFQKIDFRNQLLQAGDKILCLGFSQGAWMKYLSQVIGPGGKALFVDREGGKEECPFNVVYLREDVQRCDLSVFKEHATLFDVVFSERAVPAQMVMEIIGMYLKRDGTFLCDLEGESASKDWKKRLEGRFDVFSVESLGTRHLLCARNYKKLT